ncbi:MAG: alpha/beta hydrolase [Pseudomonadota bacterium]
MLASKPLFWGKYALALLASSLLVVTAAASALENGKGRFVFSAWSGPDLPVWYYKPAAATAESPIVIVMHGTNRDADRYRDQWSAAAEKDGFIVIAPEFSKQDFPGSRFYHLGGVFSLEGKRRKRNKWAISAIEPLFDDVVKRSKSTEQDYILYGHSAGSQFVHRFMYYHPDGRYKRVIAANAGWYTFPSLRAEFPYGLGKSGVTAREINASLEKDLVVLLGAEDNDPDDKYLRKSKSAARQGPHRLARGKNFYRFAKHQAESEQISFRWRLAVVPKVGHNNGKMVAGARLFID